MLDLQAGVHLHEIELAGRIEQELDRARARVADLARHRSRRQPHALAQHRIDGRRGRLFDDLLVPPLHGAIALAEMHDVARRVGEHLDLDVPRFDDGPLEDQPSVAERLRSLGGRAAQRAGQRVRICDPAHAAAATASRSLDHDRKADARSLGDQHALVLRVAVVAGHDRIAGRGHPAGARGPWSPIASIAVAGGPTKISPAACTAAAKAAFSERKP